MGETKVGTVIVHGLPFELSVETEATRDKRGEPVKAVTFTLSTRLKTKTAGGRTDSCVPVWYRVAHQQQEVNINSLDNLFEIVGKS